MERAFDEIEAGPVEETAETEESMETTEEEVVEFSDEEPDEELAQAEEESDEIEEPQEEEEPQGEQATAPDSWRSESKDIWDEIPELAQAEILKREQDFTKGIEKYAEKAKIADEFSQVVAPYSAMIAAEGGTPVAAFRDLLQTAGLFRTGSQQQKVQALQQIANQFGVETSLLGNEEEISSYEDPATSEMRQKLAALEQKVTNTEMTALQQQEAAAQQAIEAFKADPANVHFEQVQSRMAILLKEGEAKDLKDAYDQAVWMNPETRKAMLSSQEKQKQEKQKKIVKKAKKAAGTKIKSSSPGTKPAKKKSIEETMSEAYDRINVA
jgi:hypothetical protein